VARFGQGRPAANPEIYEIGALTQEDIDNFVPTEQAKEIGTTMRMRDSHHRIAHLCAMGLRNFEIADITGYSVPRISTLRASPAFANLVEQYRKEVVVTRQDEIDSHFTNIVRLRNLAVGELIDRFEDDEDRAKLSNGHLIAIAADGSDRTGYPKRKENINMNADFASRLDRAVARANQAKVIEGEVLSPDQPSQAEFRGGGRGEPKVSGPEALPVPFRRRLG
jgi:hypothetical protein